MAEKLLARRDMRPRTITEWQELAADSPAVWGETVRGGLRRCVERTGRSVVACDLGASCVASGPGAGPLAGVPYAVKDLFDVRGRPTLCASALPPLREHRAPEDAEVVRRMGSLGAVCCAKTQMNEFAYGLSGANPHYGDCPHPQAPSLLSGGSSSGSAHLVGAGWVPVAFGTDTGGSIRVPAAWCGLFGIRWSPGLWMEGGFPLARRFDTCGWLTADGGDMARTLRAWFGVRGGGDASRLRGAAWLPEEGVEPDTRVALSRVFAEWELPRAEASARLSRLRGRCVAAFNVLQSGEAYALHADWLERFGEAYDPNVRALLMRGRGQSPGDREAAAGTLREVVGLLGDVLAEYDFLALPAVPGPARSARKLDGALREAMLGLTTPCSLAGLPAMVIPVFLDEVRSVGVQFVFKDADPAVPLAILERCGHV